MKLNGVQNIIYESDILLESGQSLSSELSEIKNDITKLKSNTKWLYKYGGTGSGGGKGSSKPYGVVATLGDYTISDNGTIIFNEAGDYLLRVKINNAGDASYSLSFSYSRDSSTGTTTTQSRSNLVLNASNGWEYTEHLYLNNNSNLVIIVTDSSEEKRMTTAYITLPYSFKFELETIDGAKVSKTYSNGVDLGYSLMIGLDPTYYERNGINAALSYNIQITAETKISFTYEGKTTNPVILSRKVGEETFHIPNTLFVDTNAGLHSVTANVEITIDGQGTSTFLYDIPFNVIPSGLYVLVLAENGTVYNSLLESNYYEYNPGTLRFGVQIYQGAVNNNRSYTLNYRVGDTGAVLSKAVSERTTTSLPIEVNKSGENYVTFYINDGNGTYNGTKYYFYIKEINSSIDWYKEIPNITNYYRFDETTSLFNKYKSLYIQLTVNSKSLIVDDLRKPTDAQRFDTYFSIGILYSSINNKDCVILKGYNLVNSNNTLVLEITLDKITINGSEIEYYLNKTTNYSILNKKEFHLLTICSRYEMDIDNNSYYDVSVYIDGKLEKASSSLTQTPLLLTSLEFCSSNFLLDTIECSYTNRNNSTEYSITSDAIAYLYWLKYDEYRRLSNISMLADLLLYCLDFKLLDNGYVQCTNAAIDNISSKSKVPVLKLCVLQNDVTGDILLALKTSYVGKVPITLPVSIEWADRNQGISLGPVSREGVNFTITPQGSSTLNNESKNYELVAETTDSSDTAPVYIYSPNFNEDDTSTFLPEQSFTLKADVVDSSHSNNTSVGKFINTVCTKFNTGSKGKYSKFVKNCLEGFPILVFLQVSKTSDNVTINDCYYLGIYNFNLGRKSYYNLGYKDLTDLENLTPYVSNGFKFYEVEKTKFNTYKKGLVVAEILDNSPYYDFSLYDGSILFTDDLREGMFDDFVPQASDENKRIILNFVKQVALSGNYIFKLLGKNFGSYDDSYSAVDEKGPCNQVPDNSIQYKRVITNGKDDYQKILEGFSGNSTNLTDLLVYDTENEVPNYLDYTSLSEYYTICMALGLVDSVMKNMNIKTWNGKTFYIAFYDMDTSLGRDNAGRDVSYKAFSDYWEQSLEVSDDGTIVPKAINIYRDYLPKKSSEVEGGTLSTYDYPSSYLFAVAKYAALFDSVKENTPNYPQELWAKWRSNITVSGTSQGCLMNADAFIDNYYAANLNNIDTILINLNYRAKYFKLETSTTDGTNINPRYKGTDFLNFNGSLIAKTKDWLTNRFRILDAYFNINLINIPIQTYSNGEWSKEAYNNFYDLKFVGNNYALTDNSDIVVLHDIFSTAGGSLKYNTTFDFTVTSEEDSPLIINMPSTTYRYLTGLTPYHIKVATSGNETALFGGSSAWTSLDSINSFVRADGLTVSSNKLELINGTLGVIGSGNITLNTPAARNVNLNSSSYRGVLSMIGSEKYPNLDSINLSKSGILFEADSLTCTSINISNMNSTSVTIRLCSSLKTLTINPTKIGTLIIQPIPESLSSNFELKGSNITTLTLLSGIEGGTLTISDDSSLTTLTASGFANITIKNCHKLTKVSLDDTIVNLSITNCASQASTFTVKGPKVPDNISNEINMLGCTNLKLVNFNNTKKFTKASLPDETSLLLGAFSNTYIETLDGKNLKLSGYSIFYYSPKFTLRDSGGTICSLVINTENLSSTFNSYTEGVITRETALEFLSNVKIDKLPKNISSLFHHQNIEYNLDDLKHDMLNLDNPRYLNLSRFTEVTDARDAFNDTRITALNPNSFNFGAGSVKFGNFMYGRIPNDALNEGWRMTDTCYLPYDFMNNSIKDKIADYLISPVNAGWLIYKFYNINNSSVEEVKNLKLSEIFNGASKLLAIYGMSFTDSDQYTVDFENAFTGMSSLREISRLIPTDSSYKIVNFDGCLKTATNLSYIGEAFNFTSNDPVDWFEQLDWPSFLQRVNGNVLNPRGDNIPKGCCAFKKYITEDNLRTLIAYIANKPNITKISSLFLNCIIVGNSSPFELGTTLTRVTVCDNLFSGALHKDSLDSTFDLGFRINRSFFEELPNFQSGILMFHNTTMLEVPCWDMFAKALINEDKTRYIKVGNTGLDSDYVPGILYNRSYKQVITSLYGCFKNVVWKTEKRCYTHPADELRNRIVALNDSSKVDYDYYYTRREIPQIEYDSEGKIISLKTVINWTKTAINRSYEIEDVEAKFTAHRVNSAQYIDKESDNTIYNPDVFDLEVSSFCLPPNIFYGCRGDADIRYCFYTLDAVSTDCLVGMLPPHLLNSVKLALLQGTFTNMLVLPRFIKEYTTNEGGNTISNKHYLFVPDDFTQQSNLRESFNFRLYLPLNGNDSAEHIYYYILSSNSIPASTTTLAYALPSHNNCDQTKVIGSTAGWPRTHRRKFIIRLNAMGTFGNNTVDEGINITKFKDLYLDDLFNRMLSAFTYGKLFNESFIINNARKTTANSYIMEVGYSTDGYTLGANIKLPNAIQDFTNKHFMKANETKIYIWSDLILKESSRPYYESTFTNTAFTFENE